MKVLLLFLTILISIGANAAPVKNFFKDKTKIENPFDLRDPFKSPNTKADSDGAKKAYYTSGKGEYSNIAGPQLETININELKVVGVLIGRERRAMINRGTDKTVIIVKEGMKLGPESTELKAILPGGIVLVEKIINVYGQEEYLETVIPISK